MGGVARRRWRRRRKRRFLCRLARWRRRLLCRFARLARRRRSPSSFRGPSPSPRISLALGLRLRLGFRLALVVPLGPPIPGRIIPTGVRRRCIPRLRRHYVPPPSTSSGPPPQTVYSSEPDGYWYYCSASKAFYPYVKECSGGQWERVDPRPLLPAQTTFAVTLLHSDVGPSRPIWQGTGMNCIESTIEVGARPIGSCGGMPRKDGRRHV